MNWQQNELPLFVQSENMAVSQRVWQRSIDQPKVKIYTTQEVVKLLKLTSPTALYWARSHHRVYLQDRYVVIPTGQRNKWQVFNAILCS
jgi:hypothetical protein